MPDPSDEDMADAIVLGLPDGMGGSFWHPARMEDVYSVPYRTLHLFFAFRAGVGARSNPWPWFTDGHVLHQFRTTPTGRPDAPARCGAPLPAALLPVPAGERPNGHVACTACERLSGGQPASFGSIGISEE